MCYREAPLDKFVEKRRVERLVCGVRVRNERARRAPAKQSQGTKGAFASTDPATAYGLRTPWLKRHAERMDHST